MVNYVNFLLVAIGGGLGSCCRYSLSLLLNDISSKKSVLDYSSLTSKSFINLSHFPYHTFVTNILGCFLIGVAYVVLDKFINLKDGLHLFIITGFLGGFTTMSSFSYEFVNLFKNQLYFSAFSYLLLSILLSLFAVLLGFFIGSYISDSRIFQNL